MIGRYQLWISVLMFCAAVPLPASAQESEELQLASEAAIAGFECAALGAHADDEAVSAKEVTRLADFATGKARALLPSVVQSFSLPDLVATNGPFGEFLSRTSEEFWLGVLFQRSMQRMNEFVESKHPHQAGNDFETTMLLRGLAAEEEYYRRNCHLLSVSPQ